MQRLAVWTARMLNSAATTAAKIGCSPAAVVAQAAQETGWGKSAIGNNLFGIKADPSWRGLTQDRPTWEWNPATQSVEHIVARFRDYPTLAEGIEDHFNFLKANGRYRDVFDRDDTMSDEEYFRRLQKAGYATDPNYAANLTSVLSTIRKLMGNMSADGAASPPPQTRLLHVGCGPGPDVAALQTALGIPADGVFGHKTQAAVIAWQKTHPECGDADGIVGALTRSSLKLKG
jgi:hypothetical protein